jgi:hypothetical protein
VPRTALAIHALEMKPPRRRPSSTAHRRGQSMTCCVVLWCYALLMRRSFPVMDRLPFQATQAAIPYTGIRVLPVSVLLDNVRSMSRRVSSADKAEAGCSHATRSCAPNAVLAMALLGGYAVMPQR